MAKIRLKFWCLLFLLLLLQLLVCRFSSCYAQQQATSSAGASAVFQPLYNRECIEVMGIGTTLYAVIPSPATILGQLDPTPRPLTFRDVCAEVCIAHESACIGFNWGPSGTYCVLVSQGCSLTPMPMWVFFRKPRRLMLTNPPRQYDAVGGNFSSLGISGAGPAIQLRAIDPNDNITNNRLNFRPLDLSSSQNNTSESLFGTFYDVFRGTLCKLSLSDMYFTSTTTGVSGCAEICLNSSTCFGFNVPSFDGTAKPPFCELLLKGGCEPTAESSWQYFKRKSQFNGLAFQTASTVQQERRGESATLPADITTTSMNNEVNLTVGSTGRTAASSTAGKGPIVVPTVSYSSFGSTVITNYAASSTGFFVNQSTSVFTSVVSSLQNATSKIDTLNGGLSTPSPSTDRVTIASTHPNISKAETETTSASSSQDFTITGSRNVNLFESTTAGLPKSTPVASSTRVVSTTIAFSTNLPQSLPESSTPKAAGVTTAVPTVIGHMSTPNAPGFHAGTSPTVASRSTVTPGASTAREHSTETIGFETTLIADRASTVVRSTSILPSAETTTLRSSQPSATTSRSSATSSVSSVAETTSQRSTNEFGVSPSSVFHKTTAGPSVTATAFPDETTTVHHVVSTPGTANLAGVTLGVGVMSTRTPTRAISTSSAGLVGSGPETTTVSHETTELSATTIKTASGKTAIVPNETYTMSTRTPTTVVSATTEVGVNPSSVKKTTGPSFSTLAASPDETTTVHHAATTPGTANLGGVTLGAGAVSTRTIAVATRSTGLVGSGSETTTVRHETTELSATTIVPSETSSIGGVSSLRPNVSSAATRVGVSITSTSKTVISSTFTPADITTRVPSEMSSSSVASETTVGRFSSSRPSIRPSTTSSGATVGLVGGVTTAASVTTVSREASYSTTGGSVSTSAAVTWPSSTIHKEVTSASFTTRAIETSVPGAGHASSTVESLSSKATSRSTGSPTSTTPAIKTARSQTKPLTAVTNPVETTAATTVKVVPVTSTVASFGESSSPPAVELSTAFRSSVPSSSAPLESTAIPIQSPTTRKVVSTTLPAAGTTAVPTSQRTTSGRIITSRVASASTTIASESTTTEISQSTTSRRRVAGPTVTTAASSGTTWQESTTKEVKAGLTLVPIAQQHQTSQPSTSGRKASSPSMVTTVPTAIAQESTKLDISQSTIPRRVVTTGPAASTTASTGTTGQGQESTTIPNVKAGLTPVAVSQQHQTSQPSTSGRRIGSTSIVTTVPTAIVQESATTGIKAGTTLVPPTSEKHVTTSQRKLTTIVSEATTPLVVHETTTSTETAAGTTVVLPSSEGAISSMRPSTMGTPSQPPIVAQRTATSTVPTPSSSAATIMINALFSFRYATTTSSGPASTAKRQPVTSPRPAAVTTVVLEAHTTPLMQRSSIRVASKVWEATSTAVEETSTTTSPEETTKPVFETTTGLLVAMISQLRSNKSSTTESIEELTTTGRFEASTTSKQVTSSKVTPIMVTKIDLTSTTGLGQSRITTSAKQSTTNAPTIRLLAASSIGPLISPETTTAPGKTEKATLENSETTSFVSKFSQAQSTATSGAATTTAAPSTSIKTSPKVVEMESTATTAKLPQPSTSQFAAAFSSSSSSSTKSFLTASSKVATTPLPAAETTTLKTIEFESTTLSLTTSSASSHFVAAGSGSSTVKTSQAPVTSVVVEESTTTLVTPEGTPTSKKVTFTTPKLTKRTTAGTPTVTPFIEASTPGFIIVSNTTAQLLNVTVNGTVAVPSTLQQANNTTTSPKTKTTQKVVPVLLSSTALPRISSTDATTTNATNSTLVPSPQKTNVGAILKSGICLEWLSLVFVLALPSLFFV